jgi:BMFP domain-containing protein YqiC
MSNQPIGGVTVTGSQIANSKYGQTAEQATNMFNTKKKAASPEAAKLLADISKAHPLMSPGVAAGLAFSGIPANATVAYKIANEDAISQNESAKKAASQILEAVKEKGQGKSFADPIAPVTRGFFAGFSFPFEFLEALARNAFNKSPNVNPVMQTSLGQIGKELINERGQFWKVSTGSGFVGIDPTTEVGQSLKAAQIAASQQGATVPWTYGNAAARTIINSGVFGEVEDKTARTIEGVVSFAANLLLDPMLYVPGVGITKISQAKKLGKLKETTDNLTDLKTLQNSVAVSAAKRSTELGELNSKLALGFQTIREVSEQGVRDYNAVLRLENEATRLDGLYGKDYINYQNKLKEYFALRSAGKGKKEAREEIAGKVPEPDEVSLANEAALIKAREELDVARQNLLRSRSEKEKLIESRVKDAQRVEKLKGREAKGLAFASGLVERNGRYAVDFDKVQDAILGGRLGEDIAKVITDITDPAILWRGFGGNISAKTAQELAEATTSGEVLAIIGRNIGVEFDGKIGIATKARLSKAQRALQLEPSAALDPSSQLRYGKTLSLLSALDSRLPLTKASTLVDNPLTRYMPKGILVSLNDKDKILTEFDRTMSALRINETLRTNLVRGLLVADNPAATFDAVIDGIKAATDDIMARQGINLTDEQAAALREASLIFKRRGKTNFTAIAGKADDTSDNMLINGDVTKWDPVLDSQLTYAIKMPDVQEMRKYVTTIGKLSQKNASSQQISEFVSKHFDSTFKQLVLVGRVSYLLRNFIDTQTRQFLTGGVTLFNHPLSYLGMVVGNPQGNAFAKTLSKFSRYDRDVLGNEFALIAKSFPGFDREALLNAHQLSAIMGRTHTTALGNMSVGKKLPTGVRFVRSGDPKFNEAWAAQLNVLRASEPIQFAATAYLMSVGGRIAKTNKDMAKFIDDAIKTGKNEKEAFVDYLYTTEKGNAFRKMMASANPGFRAFAEDTLEARAKMGQLYDNLSETIRLNTGNNRSLIEYVAGSSLRIPDGTDVALMSYDSKDIARVLKTYRDDVDVEGIIGQIQLPIDQLTPEVARGWDAAVKGFFRFAAQTEARVAFGPEFRHQYWMEASKRIGLLTKAEAEKAYAIAQREVQGLRIGGKNVGLHPALRNMRKQISQLDDRGITLREFDDLIREKAADNISKLFYDAANRKEWAAATRIMLPFGQAWSNTLATWGKLMVTNPIADYKALNIYDWLNKPESSFVYDWVNDNWYDPSQGFIFTDPQRGDKRFIMPFVGDFLGGILSLALGEKVPAMPGFGSVSSLNVAFQTELLPGVGPAVSMSLGQIIKEQEGWWADTLREIIFPFGSPEGDLESTAGQFVPAWAQRISYGLGLDFFEGKNLSTLKPMMAYLATTGKYGEFPLDQDNQNKLMEDAAKLNRYLALWRGITQNVSPANIQPQILAKDKDGTYHVQSMMYNEFARFRMADPDNYGLATAKFADAFGEGVLFSLISNTSGAASEPTTDAWKFYSNNRDVASRYPEAFAMFFPGGDYSYEFSLWQQRRGQASKLTPQEQVRLATARVYSARKSRLEEKMKSLLQSGYDPRDAKGWYETAKEQLDAEFGGAPELRSTGLPREQLVNQAVKALQEPEFAATDAGKGLAKFLEYRTKALAEAEARGYKSLNGKNVRDVADWLKGWGYQIIKEHNDFSVMYFRLFESETDER